MHPIQGNLLTLALEGRFDAIVHGCNCHCRMGRGIALAIREQFPEAYAADQATTPGARNKLGTITTAEIFRPGVNFTVVNAYTQYDWSGKGVLADYEAITRAFRQVKEQFRGRRISGSWDQRRRRAIQTVEDHMLKCSIRQGSAAR